MDRRLQMLMQQLRRNQYLQNVKGRMGDWVNRNFNPYYNQYYIPEGNPILEKTMIIDGNNKQIPYYEYKYGAGYMD